jgi:alkylation response protein AidB-like acyl-CoA dehydrogenase
MFWSIVAHSGAPLCTDIFNHDSSRIIQLINQTESHFKSREDHFSPRAWRKETARFGLPGLDLPVELGGLGYSAVETAKVFEHIGQFSLNMRDMVGGAHARPLLKSQTPELLAIVKKVAEGNAYVAVAVTEAEAGSNMRAMSSRSEKTKNGYSLTGEKLFNARFDNATHVVIFTQAAEQDSATAKLNAFLLPIDYPGLHFKTLSAHGLHGNSFGGVSFDKMLVPTRYRIGNEGEGGKIFRDHFLYWRLMQSAAAIGTGKGALEQAAQRMRTRTAFGGPIGRFTHLQQELGEYTAKLHAASLLVEQGAKLIDQGKYNEAVPIVAMVKGEGVEWALEASDFAMRVFGAAGYSPDLTDLGQRVRDLQGLRIADGTTDIMREQVVRSIYGDDFWTMAIGENNAAAKVSSEITNDLPASVYTQVRNMTLKRRDALAFQSKFDSLVDDEGGGACPTVSIANLFQGVQVLRGSPEPLNLTEALRTAYKDIPELKKGRLSNRQVLDLFKYFNDLYFPNVNLVSRVDFQKSLWPDEKITNSKKWSDLDSSLLDPKPRELKMISYTVTENGKLIGRHFVLLKERVKTADEDTVFVVDPTNPTKDFVFNLKRIDVPGDGSSFQLIRPGTPKSSRTLNVINSVYTVQVPI